MSAGASIDGKTRVYGILGHPVTGSLSPAMQNAAFQALGINAVYLAFPVLPDDLPGAAAGLAAANVAGFNLTVPHKLAILPLLREITPEAKAIGAVNTVRCGEGGMAGANTDGEGFLLSLQHDLAWKPRHKQVLLLGAGGAARGIAISLLGAGLARLHIANRTVERAQALAADCRALYPAAQVTASGLEGLGDSAPHLLINSTTMGMRDTAMRDTAMGNTGMGSTDTGETAGSPLELAPLGVREAVIDIVYYPTQTPLLAQARALGLAHTNGIGMLLHQGALAFHYWTGQDAPLEVMRAALESGLAAR